MNSIRDIVTGTSRPISEIWNSLCWLISENSLDSLVCIFDCLMMALQTKIVFAEEQFATNIKIKLTNSS